MSFCRVPLSAQRRSAGLAIGKSAFGRILLQIHLCFSVYLSLAVPATSFEHDRISKIKVAQLPASYYISYLPVKVSSKSVQPFQGLAGIKRKTKFEKNIRFGICR